MQKTDYTIRRMTRQEVDIAIDWAAAEGWNPGLSDANCFYAADPNGFLIGLLGDEPIATISAVKYGHSFGFAGFYMVKPEYRGRGFGIQIWKAGLEQLSGRTIGLDGVVDQQENYKRSGFVFAYRNIRYQGSGGGVSPIDSGVVPLSAIPFDKVLAYDKSFFPAGRTPFLACWINQPQSTALGILENRKLAGYGVIRTCRSGCKIGPLFADSPELAHRLFLALRTRASSSDPIFLDTPEVNSAAVDLAEHHNLTVTFETARMYTGTAPDLPINRLFGVTTFELG
jgi:GNAT superfamily N-acetyltransferase